MNRWSVGIATVLAALVLKLEVSSTVHGDGVTSYRRVYSLSLPFDAKIVRVPEDWNRRMKKGEVILQFQPLGVRSNFTEALKENEKRVHEIAEIELKLSRLKALNSNGFEARQRELQNDLKQAQLERNAFSHWYRGRSKDGSFQFLAPVDGLVISHSRHLYVGSVVPKKSDLLRYVSSLDFQALAFFPIERLEQVQDASKFFARVKGMEPSDASTTILMPTDEYYFGSEALDEMERNVSPSDMSHKSSGDLVKTGLAFAVVLSADSTTTSLAGWEGVPLKIAAVGRPKPIYVHLREFVLKLQIKVTDFTKSISL